MTMMAVVVVQVRWQNSASHCDC